MTMQMKWNGHQKLQFIVKAVTEKTTKCSSTHYNRTTAFAFHFKKKHKKAKLLANQSLPNSTQ